MTEIKSAIDHLDNLIGMIEDNQGTDYDADFRLAIRSLQAWEEVLQELGEKKEQESSAIIIDYEWKRALDMCIDIINQKLEEIEK